MIQSVSKTVNKQVSQLVLTHAPLQMQHIIFNLDGSLTSEALQACQLMQVDPKSVSIKPITEQELIN